MRFYKDHYDVVIIGGALAGMAAALQLQAKGVRDILILEKHNMPGGVATDYMRDGFEIEASLHEMMSIGPKGKRLKVGQFFDDMGVDIDWLPVPEPYRVVVPSEGSDLGVYHVGHALKNCLGVLEAYDMTTEAVVAKLMWILGRTRDRAEVERRFYTPVARDILWPTES